MHLWLTHQARIANQRMREESRISYNGSSK
jgi:hypothetical protein